GVLFLARSTRADLGMRLIQPDGSEAEMCGNGIRCLAKYAWDGGYVGERFDVETLAGIIPVQVREGEGSFWAKVNMGQPKFDRPAIPACGSGDLLQERIEELCVSAVNTGVPHAVVFVDDLDFDIMKLAPSIRHSSLFPEGANVNFVKLGQHLEIRTFERGVEGETLSCGTGSVAAASIARRLGMAGDEVVVQTRGGPLISASRRAAHLWRGRRSLSAPESCPRNTCGTCILRPDNVQDAHREIKSSIHPEDGRLIGFPGLELHHHLSGGSRALCDGDRQQKQSQCPSFRL
ncbi:MAG: diaminopimelate epimerase, partial [Methanothrix sp.]|nr:diaminopimelate epimerase [Methanothrix sp.]